MKTVIIGAKGMLGHALMEQFQDISPLGWDLSEIDITKGDQVTKKIGKEKPQIIINAAAYTNVDKAEGEKDFAFNVNAQGVGNLAKAASEGGAILVHYSTDYVFGDNKKEGYQENDIPQNPLNVYGASKLAGEQEIVTYNLQPTHLRQGFGGQATYNLKYYLIRSSWLFGPDGKNFVQTIINLYATQSPLKIVNDQWGKPTYTKDLAKATRQLIDNNYHFGIYHLVNEPATNWYDFTEEIIAIKYGNKSQKQIIPVFSEEFPRPAKRPHYSILLNTQGPKLREWKEALNEYIPKI